ncbi:hypothetical protein GCM10010404_85850 [Nonomuraea africana]|uniref:Uncharacterized protein n=1 Tax=Nonomuraea africana TaxID=46171 RepID=A0ABR9K896_9ACTN|nr:hypothetical protein [Nonomuraea africana]MBE1558226.1 hypothetical protein [Nonomuraea africana]
MPKRTFGTPNNKGGFGRRGSSVTVIQNNVQYSYLRTAKITFYVVLAIVGLFAAVISTYYLPPLAAVPVGLVAGTLVGGLVAGVVAIWPVLRVIWWWLPETTLTLLLVGGWWALAERTNPIITGVVYALVIGIVAAVPVLRHLMVALAWCLIVRHRLRTCFNAFVHTDRHGHLPFIGWAKPIPVGERVWVWLRPGLSAAQLETQLDRIAVACWATSVTVTKASTSNSARIRLDIKRRDVLGAVIGSPLTDELPTIIPADTTSSSRSAFTVPDQLDLVDVPEPDDPPSGPRPNRRNGRTPAANGQPAAVATNSDDDWI